MPRRLDRAVEIAVLVSILLLAGYLRLLNVSQSPGWYSDEGTILNITQNLLEGRWQYMAINQSTLIAARLPLFPLLLAGASRIFGPGIGTLRTLTGALGVLSVGLVYLFVRQVLGRQGAALALISALILAIYPSAILYSRFGFSYNLLPALALLSALWIWKYQETDQKRWMILACSMIGIGALSDIVMLAIAIPLFLVILIHRARDIPLAVLITLLPSIIFASTMMASAPEAFLFDAQFTLSRTSQIPLIAQFPLAVIGFGTLPIWDPWLAAGLIGLFMLRPSRFRWLALGFFILPILFLGRTGIGFTGLGFYFLIPVLPMACIGIGALLRYGAPAVEQMTRSGLKGLRGRIPAAGTAICTDWLETRLIALGASLLLFIVMISPLLASVVTSIANVNQGFPTPVDPVILDPQEAISVANFVNASTRPDDLVIASPALAWALDARVADFQQALIAEGVDTIHLPGNLPSDRFAYDTRYSQARFVVIDPIWRNWAAQNMVEVAEMMSEVETWELAFKAGELEVYENPRIKGSGL